MYERDPKLAGDFDELTPAGTTSEILGASVKIDAEVAAFLHGDQFTEVIGRYMILEPLGISGEAELFAALELRAEGPPRACVLKRPKKNQIAPLSRRRFVEEARIGSDLSHANLVKTFDCFEHEGVPYVARELIDGISLRALLRLGGDEGIPLPAIVCITSWIAEVLTYVHDFADEYGQGLELFHGELSPSSVLLCSDGELKISEVSITKLDGKHLRAGRGARLGRLGYAPPEQLGRRKVDGRTDVYALGVILFELLRGKSMVWDGTLELAELMEIVNVEGSTRSDLPRGLIQLILEMISLSKEQRPDADEVSRRLSRILEPLGRPKDIAHDTADLLKKAVGLASTATTRRLALRAQRVGEAAVISRRRLQAPKGPRRLVDAASSGSPRGEPASAIPPLDQWSQKEDSSIRILPPLEPSPHLNEVLGILLLKAKSIHKGAPREERIQAIAVAAVTANLIEDGVDMSDAREVMRVLSSGDLGRVLKMPTIEQQELNEALHWLKEGGSQGD